MDPVSRAAAAARARDAAIAAAYRKEVSPARGGYSQGQYGQGQAYATPGHHSQQQYGGSGISGNAAGHDPSGGDLPSTGQGQGQASRRSASAPRGSRSALRSRARDEAEQAAREQRERELEECTFRPQTRRLPSQYGSSRRALESVPFAERMEQWKRHKVQESERRKKEEEDREVSKCTFQPRISAVSRKTVARQRQMGGAVPAHERLYRSVTPARALKMKTPSSARGMVGAQTSFSSRHGGQTGPYGGVSSASGAGLQQQQQGLEHTASRARPDYKTMEERELEQCTFQPQTNPKLSRRSAHPVRSRFRQAAKARSLGVQLGKPKYTGAEECTFAPRVNPVSKAMANARKYVEKPVFERMSERARAGAGNSNGRSQSAPRARRGPAAEARAMGGAGGGGASTLGGYDEGAGGASGQLDDSRFGSVGGSTMGAGGSMRRGRRSEGGDQSRVMDLSSFRRAMDGGGVGDLEGKEEDGGREGKASPRTAAERKKRFKQFLQRQNHTLARKAKSVQLLKEQTAAPHQPRLCRRSVEMVSAETHGTFLERMAKKAVLREHANQQERARVAKSADCTFEPKINRHSKQMPRRSYAEMSRGDALKRETAQRLMKLKLEQDEIGQFEFAPKINDKSRQAQGKLRVLDDPETYVERVHREQAIQAERARQQALQAESTEYDECTFKPEVHDAPEYIKRIAKTMALTRAARPPSPSEQNPRWR